MFIWLILVNHNDIIITTGFCSYNPANVYDKEYICAPITYCKWQMSCIGVWMENIPGQLQVFQFKWVYVNTKYVMRKDEQQNIIHFSVIYISWKNKSFYN